MCGISQRSGGVPRPMRDISPSGPGRAFRASYRCPEKQQSPAGWGATPTLARDHLAFRQQVMPPPAAVERRRIRDSSATAPHRSLLPDQPYRLPDSVQQSTSRPLGELNPPAHLSGPWTHRQRLRPWPPTETTRNATGNTPCTLTWFRVLRESPGSSGAHEGSNT